MNFKSFLLHLLLKGATVTNSVEKPEDTYICVKGVRFVFKEGTYAGWHKP